LRLSLVWSMLDISLINYSALFNYYSFVISYWTRMDLFVND
jgi:hypothetical protein